MSRFYSQEDIRYGQENMLECAACGDPIILGKPMTYLVRMQEGYAFYHSGACAEWALKDAGINER